MAELYRIKMGMRSGAASWGKWDYYEDENSFKEKLLLALISEEATRARGSRLIWRSARAWLGEILEVDENKPQIDRVFAAEKLVEGEWVDLKPRLIPPSLEFD
jgi:hypothetical protein